MTALRLSMFRNLYDTVPVARDVSVADVVAMCSDWSRVVSPESRPGRVPLWSPVEYRPGTKRGSDGVFLVHMLALDYDDGTPVEEVRRRWSGWVHIGHTSYSHQQWKDDRPPMPAVRVILPLLEPVDAAVWSRVIKAVMEHEGREADARCVDPARMFYVPCLASTDAPHTTWVHMPAGGVDSPWLCLADRVEDARRAIADAERRKQERLRRVSARARDVVESHDEAEREARRRLLEDPRTREDFGHMVGGRLVDRASGRMVIGVTCPSCGRLDVWWVVDPQNGMFRAACNHEESCGWRGHLWELAALLDVDPTT